MPAPPDESGPTPTSPPTARADRVRQDWRVVLAVFWVTSMVEGIGVSQIFAFLPQYLAQMGVTGPDRLQFVGLFSSLIFVVGAPLVPLWGVWADKYSRKAVIIRSALVEAAVFAGVALAQQPWQLALAIMLSGLQLGNTGVMLAAIRDVAPRARLGTVIGVFGASAPIGLALGPVIGGVIVDGLHLGLTAVYLSSSLFSLGTALLVAVATHEVRPSVIPQGPVLRLAYGAIRGALTDPATRRIFAVYFTAFLATQMSRPYVPVLVERLNPGGAGLASDIAFVVGAAALAGAIVSPLGGAIGDRIGFRTVLEGALIGGGIVLALEPFMASVPALAAAALVFAGLSAAVTAMVFGLLATEVPPERRSATLNLVYLPLYAAGIIGPTVGSVVVTTGLAAPYLVAGAVIVCAGLFLVVQQRRAPHGPPRADAAADDARAAPDAPAAVPATPPAPPADAPARTPPAPPIF